jgi:hypothetical protein
MYYKDEAISFKIPRKWSIVKNLVTLQWNIALRNKVTAKMPYMIAEYAQMQRNFLWCFMDLRIISAERSYYTLHYIEQKGMKISIQFPPIMYIPEKIKTKNVFVRKMNFAVDYNNPVDYYLVLITSEQFSIKLQIKISPDDKVENYLSWIKTIFVNEQFIQQKIREISQWSRYDLQEFVTFFKGLLCWTAEDTLIRLENIRDYFRDDIEDRESVFQHESTHFWIMDLFLSEIGLSHIDFSCKQKLLDMILRDKKSCIKYTDIEWAKIRMLLSNEFKKISPQAGNAYIKHIHQQ